MKNLQIITFSLLLLICSLRSNSQVINFNSERITKHIVNANMGLDYSVSYGLGYGHRFNTKIPILVNASFSTPSGESLLDDFKTKIGGQIQLLNWSNFAGILTINGIYRRHQTKYVRLQNFGSEFKGTFGYYRSKWFLATEIGFDKAIVTHFKHSQIFKDEVYSDVVNGWYEPATGGNFHYGLQLGVSFGKHDIYLSAGKIIQQDFKTSPAIPFYAQLGYNFKFGKY